jgi:hypothetical protein
MAFLQQKALIRVAHSFFWLSLVNQVDLQAQANIAKPNPAHAGFGYIDKGDSIEFVFGQQKTFMIGGVEVNLEKRMSEIKQVNLAGDFNGWNPAADHYQLTKAEGKLFKISLSKTAIGKKGELRQFKFVLNHTYWVEPPLEATNRFTGKDGNTNLTLQL